MKVLLFSYGTLQLEKVQLDTYGRLLVGRKDQLPAYKLEQLEITDEAVLAKSEQQFHPIAVYTGSAEDFVEGTIFEISEEDLRASDKYEVADYVRVHTQFASGTMAWVYVKQN